MLQAMKLINLAFILIIALATLAKATPQNFTYGGIQTQVQGTICSNWFIGYTVTDDAKEEDRKGYFEVKGCMGSLASLGDGTFILDIDSNTYTANLTDLACNVTLHGQAGEHQGNVKACTAISCPPPTIKTCFWGAGPNGTEPGEKNCGFWGH